MRDIGQGITVEVVHSDLAGGEAVGLDWEHPGRDRRCPGFIYFDTPKVREVFSPAEAQMWTLEKLDPLTVSPSLLCLACGCHGFVREGCWVAA